MVASFGKMMGVIPMLEGYFIVKVKSIVSMFVR